MPISISIEPLSSCLDMYDSPDTLSAYSLSGHVSIKHTSSIFGLAKQPSQDLFLASLELSFEGQSELIINGLGYIPLRIFTLSEELISSKQPIPISSNEQNAEWRIVFNLALPGWLPATCLFGDNDEKNVASVTYGLSARARFLSTGEFEESLPSSSISSGTNVWNNLCSVVRRNPNKPRIVNAEHVSIHINRYISLPVNPEESGHSVSPFPTSTFAVQATPSHSTSIPSDILRSVQLHAIVPSRISMCDDSVPLTIRLRCRYEDPRIRNNLKVYSLETDIVQVEKYHTSPAPTYTSRFPLPPLSEQPPRVPLRTPHSHLNNLFDFGLVATPSAGKLVPHECSLVPPGASRTFKAHGSNGKPEGASFEDGWVRMEVDIPVIRDISETKHPSKRITTDGPLFEVYHQMRIRVTVGYEHLGGIAMDDLAFVIPLEFVNVQPRTTSPLGSPFFPIAAQIYNHSRRLTTSPIPIPHSHIVQRNSRNDRSCGSLSRSSTSSSRPYTPSLSTLPAYNQLYTENGYRRDELFCDLPVYREKVPSPLVIARGPCSSTSSLNSSCPSLRNSPSSTPDSPRSLSGLVPPPELLTRLQNRADNELQNKRPKYRETLPRSEDVLDIRGPRSNGTRRPLLELPENDIRYGVTI
ncbi:hypothetical protein Clacol_006797 [Clathrus columnatus]|uniref:Arrestin-like N-terminal domain-containing protein n=1 Tax=Clathrus columnatus TaxID=1419009 RepID=A0AAV5AD35_9AGAM|nr:hypothetical protein Clacol_006797 [Clathrus columnatus]